MIKFLYAKAPGKSNFVKVNVGNYHDENEFTYVDVSGKIYTGSTEYEDEEGEIVTETSYDEWVKYRKVLQLVKQGTNTPKNMEDFASDLSNVFIKCYGITSIEDMAKYDKKSIVFYELNKESTKKNLKLTLLWPQTGWSAPSGSCIFVLGDYSRGIYMFFGSDYGPNYTGDFPHDATSYTGSVRIFMNPKYKNASNLKSLMDLAKKVEQENLSTNSFKTMNMIDNAPFMFGSCHIDTIYNIEGSTGQLLRAEMGYSGLDNTRNMLSFWQRRMCNLTTWNNWYTMLFGKHFYGTPNRLKLKSPITDTDGTQIKYIELTSPITIYGYSSVFNRDWYISKSGNINSPLFQETEYNESISITNPEPNDSGIPQPYMSNCYRYYDCGHDIDAIFSIAGVESLELDNGYKIMYDPNSGFGTQKRTLYITDGQQSVVYSAYFGDIGLENSVADVWQNYMCKFLVQPRSFSILKEGWDKAVATNIKGNKWSEILPIMVGVSFFIYSPIKEIDYNISANGASNYITNLSTRNLFSLDDPAVYGYNFRAGVAAYDIEKNDFWDKLLTACEVNEKEFIAPDPVPDNPNPGGYSPGSNGSIGGNGTYNPNNNIISGSEKPKIEITSLGNLFRNYVVSINTLSQLGTWMNSFTSVIPEGTNPSDTALVIEQATKYAQFNDKASAIVSLKVIYTPTALPTSGSQNITVNSEDTGLSSPVLSSQYIKGTMGTYRFNRYYDSFLDYSPYTTIELYLPFYGILRLEPESFMDDTLIVNYTIDVLTGILTYEIMNSKNGVLYTAEGNCSYEVPLTATDYSGKISALQNLYNIRNRTTLEGLTTALGAITSGANGNLGGAVSSIASITNRAMDANEAAINYQHTKIPVSRTGNISGSAGLGAPLYPYLVIKRARMAMPTTMGSEMGFRSNISATLGSLSGFTKVQNIKLSNMGIATAEEISMVKEQLMNGVII